MNNKQPLVSIAVCTYNGERFLREQLDSLVSQSYRSLEILVVDDCSKDHTLAILKQYEEKHPNFKVYQNDQNLGYIKNFEKAISLSNGDYIALCDQDDIWHPNKIERQLSAIGNYSLIYHDSEFITEGGISKNAKISDVRNFYKGNDSDVFLLENCVSGHAILFKKELKPLLNKFSPIVFHDWWITFIACHVSGVTYLNESLVQYRQHENASTDILKSRNNKQKAISGIIKEFEILKTFYSLPLKKGPIFEKLMNLYRKRMNAYFSFSLAFLIYRKRRTLVFIKKKSLISKVNLILKYSWGYKLKKLLN